MANEILKINYKTQK